MSSTLTTTTGYGFAVTNEVLDAWRSMAGDRDLWEFIENKYPALTVDMAAFYDYHPGGPDDVAYAVLAEGSITREYGVGVYNATRPQLKLAPLDDQYQSRQQLVEAADELGIPGAPLDWYTVVSYG